MSGRRTEPAVAKHDSVDAKAANHKLRFARMVRTLCVCQRTHPPTQLVEGEEEQKAFMRCDRVAHAGSHRPDSPSAAESRLLLSSTPSISRTRCGPGRERGAPRGLCCASPRRHRPQLRGLIHKGLVDNREAVLITAVNDEECEQVTYAETAVLRWLRSVSCGAARWADVRAWVRALVRS